MGDVVTFKLRENEEYIELVKLLKILNIAESGAMSQSLVTNKEVRRNGEIETRKRAKIRANEVISVRGFEIKVC